MPHSGEIRSAQIYVGVLGTSSYTYAEATYTESLPNRITSHQRMLHFFENVPALLVPDNLKAAVTQANRYEPEINSVPHALVGRTLDLRISASSIEVMHQGQRVAAHARHGKGRFTTVTEHMPKSHQAHRQWSPGRFRNWATDIGPATAEIVKKQLQDRPHPEHGYRACLGLLNLSRRYTRQRLEAACERALSIRSASYKRVASILQQGLDRLALEPEADPQGELPLHTNVRGADYYYSGRTHMLNQQTREQLRTLKLTGMLDALEQQSQPQTHDLCFEERLALLVEREVLHRENRRLSRLLKAAKHV